MNAKDAKDAKEKQEGMKFKKPKSTNMHGEWLKLCCP